MKRCVIVGGADINNYEYIKSCLHNDDFIVFCDSGLKHLESLQVKPGLIVGDFDSHDNPHLGVETIVLPCEKDDTDAQMDLKNNASGRSLVKSMDLPSNPPNGMVIPYLISNNIATATKNGKLVRFVVNGVQYSTLRATNSATTN